MSKLVNHKTLKYFAYGLMIAFKNDVNTDKNRLQGSNDKTSPRADTSNVSLRKQRITRRAAKAHSSTIEGIKS